jgi:hypothetical protein
MISHDQLAALAGDQIKYFDFSLKWPDLLTQQIPFGFPLFLRLVGWMDHTYKLLPWLTLVLWATSLAFLGWALRRAGWGIAMMLGIVAPLSVSILMRPWAWHGNPYFYANTERLTAILSTVIFGLCILANEEWKSKWYWLIGGLVFVSCLCRAAMLFLPIVVLWQVPRYKLFRSLLILFGCFIVNRWVMFDDPSFASYGAVQATRIYAMMVEPGDLDKVPEKFHPLMKEIIWNIHDPNPIPYDREGDRDLYVRWYNGDTYTKYIIVPYLKTHFKTDAEGNAFLRELWGYEFHLHWRERVSIYFRSLRVALTKIQDPVIIFGLLGLFWLRVIAGMNVLPEYTEHLVEMFRWFSAWTFFSITTLLLVQFPDDRYMQICFLWLPSMIGAAIGFIL